MAVPALVADVKEPELLSLIAEFYFSHDYWQEALDVFEIIDGISEPSAQIYQKIGHCLMKLGRTSDAVAALEKADMLDNRSSRPAVQQSRHRARPSGPPSLSGGCQGVLQGILS